MRIAVLAYHGNNIGPDYGSNDHLALGEDLRLLHRLGLPLVSAHAAVAMLRGEQPGPDRAVVLTCDDAPVFDWEDIDYPGQGVQRSFRSLLLEHQRRSGTQAHLTCFAIASPLAREQLDQRCLRGLGWMRDDWWPQAAAEGLLAIENHSWDHNHEQVDCSAQRENRRGSFRHIETWAEADAEIRQAADWLDAHCPAGPRRSLFAYPYGETSDYLVQEYLPRHAAEHRVRAAFTTEPRPISRGDGPWTLGRYVAGFHWREPSQLELLLREALG
jgi:peptidoglycan/xylan/chitin deacetylase (PgdA/CDA1 family)